MGGIPVFGGGIIPDDDTEELHKLGIQKIFKPGSTTQEIIDWIKDNVEPAEEDS